MGIRALLAIDLSEWEACPGTGWFLPSPIKEGLLISASGRGGTPIPTTGSHGIFQASGQSPGVLVHPLHQSEFPPYLGEVEHCPPGMTWPFLSRNQSSHDYPAWRPSQDQAYKHSLIEGRGKVPLDPHPSFQPFPPSYALPPAILNSAPPTSEVASIDRKQKAK